jgi:hypothetical protein
MRFSSPSILVPLVANLGSMRAGHPRTDDPALSLFRA